jgi:iron complex transport system ATP-binding protein
MRERAFDALAQVHASALADRQVAELSTGEMRRVLIARALVHQPQALLLDEPTAGLDPVARQHFLGLMRQLARRGITLVLVTHHIEEIIPEIDRVLLLRDGAVYADGERQSILTSDHLSHAFAGPVQVRHEAGYYHAVAAADPVAADA